MPCFGDKINFTTFVCAHGKTQNKTTNTYNTEYLIFNII